MKSNKLMAAVLLCCMALFTVVSCNGEKPEEQTPSMVGNTIYLPNELDATVKANVEFTSSWQIRNSNAWFTVSPLIGDAGPVELEIQVNESNSALEEKVGSFTVLTAEDVILYFVIQDPKDGIIVTKTSATSVKKGSAVSIPVEGNITYTAASEVDWVTIGNIEYADSTILDDEFTKSRYVASTLNVVVAENKGDLRTGKVVITDKNGEKFEVEITQNGAMVDPDYSKDFFRRTFMIKHTADWCGPCGAVNAEIHKAQEARPDRFLYAAFYSNCNAASLSRWKGAGAYFNLTGSTGIPTLVINNYAQFIGGTYSTTFNALIDDAKDNVKSHTTVAGESQIDGNEITVNVAIASKQSGDYNVSLFLLEDGLMYNQTGYSGGKYQHNNVTRNEMTVMYGEKVALTANKVTEKTFTATIPSYVENKDNLHVYVVVYRYDTYTGSVAGPTYVNYKGMIVDNVADIPGNGFTAFKYEE